MVKKLGATTWPCYIQICVIMSSVIRGCAVLTFLHINEPVHEISNNEVGATSKASDQPVHMLEYSMIVKLLTEHHL